MVVAEPMNRIGADTLLKYDLLIGWQRVAFRPRQANAEILHGFNNGGMK
jgi:hypothetical protein